MKKISLVLTYLLFLFLTNCASLSSSDPVYHAALTGNMGALNDRLLLTSDVNVRNADGNTALMWAVYNKNEVMVRKFLEFGARVGYRDKYGNSTLMIAKNYQAPGGILDALRTSYEFQLTCSTPWQIIKGFFGFRKCVSFAGKSISDEELDTYTIPSDGTETKVSQITVLKLLAQKKLESDKALLSRRNMSERDRIKEYSEITGIYQREGSSESNEIAKDKFEVCQMKGNLELKPLNYEEDKKNEFDKKYNYNLLKKEKDIDSEFWLKENTSQFEVISIEDLDKFLLLKTKLYHYTGGIVSDFEKFFIYNDLANEKTIEKDYQRMAHLLAQIVIYKVNNYKRKKETLSGCNLSFFTANDAVLEKLKTDAQTFLTNLSKRVSNDKNAPLHAIQIKSMNNEPVDNECNAILNDSPKKYSSHRDLAQALTWCYASISDSRGEAFFKRITELSDPIALREAENIKKQKMEGKPITMPSMAKVETKANSLAGPQSQKYKLAVLTFIDQTQSNKGDLVRYALTDILTSELYETHRFSLVDREDLIQIERGRNSALTVNLAEEENGTKETKEPTESKEEKATKDIVIKPRLNPSTKSNKGTEMGHYDISTEYALRRTEIERENMRGRELGIDGYLLGYITSIDLRRGTMELDFRIVYPVNINREANGNVDTDTEMYIQSLRNLVVYGANAKVKINYDDKRDMISVRRSDVQNMAIGIKQAFADTETINKNLLESAEYFPEEDEFVQPSEINPRSKGKTVAEELKPKEKPKPTLKVMKIEGDKIIINAGSNHKVRSGLVGYVIDPADFGTYRYLARFEVEQVFEKSSRCIVLEGVDNLSKEGQSVIIK